MLRDQQGFLEKFKQMRQSSAAGSAILPFVSMAPEIDEKSPSNASGSLSTPASDLRRQLSLDEAGDVRMNGTDDSEVSDAEENPGSNGPRTKKPRISHACQACRRMKIRCEPLDDRNSCKQCAKTNRECLITAPRRKRQKTVHRVAELEKKIEALTASLGSREGHEEPLESENPPAYFPSANTAKASDLSASIAEAIRQSAKDTSTSTRKWNKEETVYVDVIDSGLIDEASAYLAFQRFTKEMSHYFPVVVFPPSTTAQEIRSKRPILFLSILAAAIGNVLPGMQTVLSDELTYIIADRVMYRGERSLELVQALLVLMSFYSRPKHQKELNFNQTIHVAATMALDLGMGRRSKKGVFAESSLFPGVSVVETRRTWLGCYYMCANAAMSLRHPIFIRWSPYMDESIELLTTSPDAHPSDLWLCDVIRLQHIAEEVAFMFSMDDPASVVSLTDAKTQYHMKTFERQLAQWRKSVKSDASKPWVRHIEATVNLYLHEIAIHFDHNVDDFRPPPHTTEHEHNSDFVTPAHIDSLITCMESIHTTFDSFFEMDTETIRNLPNLFFVRNAYAAVALIKMDGVLHTKGSKFGSIFAPDLKVDSYLNTMIEVQERAAEGGRCNVAMAFCFVFKKLRGWYKKKKDPRLLSTQPGNRVPTCANLMDEEEDEEEQLTADAPDLHKIGREVLQEQAHVQSAAAGPTTVFGGSDQSWAAGHLGFPMGQHGQSYMTSGISDTTMFNLGLPQFYDFGFTFDDVGMTNAAVEDSSWMGFSI